MFTHIARMTAYAARRQGGDEWLKQTNMRLGRALSRLRRWSDANMDIMRSAWPLYRAVAGRAAVIAGVLLVAPYVLVALLTMQAVSYDLGRGLQMVTGVGYVGDWAGAIVGRLQALSSLTSLLSYAMELLLLPGACAAFALIFATRWQGMALNLSEVWRRVRPLIMRIVMAGFAVMIASNFAQLAVSLVSGLLSMVAGLLSFIPVIGMLVYWVVCAALMVIWLGMALLELAVLMFTMLTMTGEDGARGQLLNNTLRVLWGGRRDVLPSVGWLMTACALALIVCAAVYGVVLAAAGAVAAIVAALIVLARVACAAIPLMCAFLTVLYMREHERQGGRTYIYTRQD